MASTAAKVIRKRGALTALITALGVAAALLITWVLQLVFGLVGRDPLPPTDLLAGMQQNLLSHVLPVTIGVFLSLWIIAPVAAQLRLGHVISRAILAAGIGGTLLFLVGAVEATLAVLSTTPPAAQPGTYNVDLGGIGGAVLSYLSTAMVQFVALLPIVVLAGILEWIWLERHPRDHVVTGLVDDV